MKISTSQIDELMDEAIALAGSASAAVYPNPRVGAIYWKEGKILGKGYHAKCGEAHAEIEAAKGLSDLKGSTLIVTLEPCSHRGKTPPCADFLIDRGVKTVIFGASDPNPNVDGVSRLERAGIEVQGPHYRPGLWRLLGPFAKNIRKKTYFICKWAMTLDGKIATRELDSKWISSEQSRSRVHEMRSKVDGILVGAGTVLADLPDLGLHECPGIPPRPIVWDPKAGTAKLTDWWQAKAERRPVVLTRVGQKADWPSGVEVIELAEFRDIDEALYERGVHCVLVEGGSATHGEFFDSHRVDELCVFISPKVIGGTDAKTAVAGLGLEKVASADSLVDVMHGEVDGDLYVQGLLKKPEIGD